VGGVGERKGERRAVTWLLGSSNGEVEEGGWGGVEVDAEAEVEVEVKVAVDVDVDGWRVDLRLGGLAKGSCGVVGVLGREDERRDEKDGVRGLRSVSGTSRDSRDRERSAVWRAPKSKCGFLPVGLDLVLPVLWA
jgi:hypothetical protein